MHQMFQRRSQPWHIARWHQQAGLTGNHLLARAGNVAGHHRQAAQHGFDHAHRQALEMAGQDKDIRSRHDPRHIRTVSKHDQPRAKCRTGRSKTRAKVHATVAGQARAHHP